MSNRLANPNPQFFDNSGQPLNGGVLRTYLTTTSTPAQTYSDAALTISNGSAITLDSAGRSPVSIFLDPAVTLKVTLETSAGVVLWTRDPVVDLAANINASVQVYAGNPNTHVAGSAGTPGSSGASMVFDITNQILYICTTTGNAASAVWTAISNSFTGGEDIYTATQTITSANIGRIATMNSAVAAAFNLTAAATLGASKLFVFKNIGAGALSIDPAGAELIEGIASIVLLQNQSAIVECTGGAFRVIAFYDGLMDTIGQTSFPTEITVTSASGNILGAASEAVAISGTTTITSFGTGPNRHRYCRATGAFIITYNATTLICPGAANITTAVGDTWEVVSDASSNARITNYQRSSIAPVPPAVVSPVGMVLLASGTVSAAATLDLVLTAYTAYRGLKFILSGFVPVTDGVDFLLRFSTNGGSSYDAGAGNYGLAINTGLASSNGTGTAIFLTGGLPVGNAANEALNAEVTILNQTSAVFNTRATFQAAWMDNAATSALNASAGGGARLTAQDTDAVRFLFSSGNISAGNYALYGLV